MDIQKILFLFLCFLIIILVGNLRKEEFNEEIIDTNKFPRLVHLIYFPWDSKTMKLKDDPYDFDDTFYRQFKKDHPDFEIKLWTLPEAERFVRANYPDVWPIITSVDRPVMMVDIFRWLVVYHYGGIYWQYGSKPLVPLDNFIPGPGKRVKLHTEAILTPDFCQAMAKEPIRNGEPEEPIRVYSCFFGAYPRDPYIENTLDVIVRNIRLYSVKKDYDILYITGNAAISTVYDIYGKNNSSVELVPLEESKKAFEVHSKKSWRLEPLE